MNKYIEGVMWSIAGLLAIATTYDLLTAYERREVAAKRGEILIRVDKVYYKCKDTGIRW